MPTYCEDCERDHQARERRVLCNRCAKNETADVHGTCDACRPALRARRALLALASV